MSKRQPDSRAILLGAVTQTAGCAVKFIVNNGISANFPCFGDTFEEEAEVDLDTVRAKI